MHSEWRIFFNNFNENLEPHSLWFKNISKTYIIVKVRPRLHKAKPCVVTSQAARQKTKPLVFSFHDITWIYLIQGEPCLISDKYKTQQDEKIKRINE